ncbi:MAG TPA: ElyC/SanA/YdcF family protein [Pilimelia sp.]|nr:ElyC/SanA/YdcF family protein [Pilimelia sp.]
MIDVPGGRRRRWPRPLLRVAVVAAVIGALTVAGSVAWLRLGARGHLYDPATAPAKPVALVLGAQVYPDGDPSPFLAARLAVAKDLYDRGTVRAVLVSGDHGKWAYDEPGAMARWLIDRGVPAGKVVRDHAGFDTYDSCQRARRVFGVRAAIVVTQTFHLARAVTLCRRAGVDAAGVGDDSVRRYAQPWRRGVVREYGAAVKAAVDVLSGRDPTHLGPRERAVDEAVAR